MIRLTNISKHYHIGHTLFYALQDISLTIEKGEFVSILGPSGSGKSTLMHCMGGLDHPSSGVVEVNGERLSDMRDAELARFRNSTVGFVFQFFNLLPQLSSLDNVMLPLVYARTNVDRISLATKALTVLGLGKKLRNRPGELSGGEQQRVALARALIHDPDIVLADEPTGNLDSKTGSQIVEIFSLLHQEGKTVVIVTHDEALAGRAQRIIRIQDGKIA